MNMNAPTTLAVFDGINQWLKDVNLKPGNSNLSPAVDWLFMFILWVCIISFIMLMVPMFYWAWRWRRKPGVPPIRTPNHNTILEVTWVVGPLIVVTFIFFYGFWGYMDAMVKRNNGENITVGASMWSWSAMYERNGSTPQEYVYLDDKRQNGEDKPGAVRGNELFPVIYVPAGTPLNFKIFSTDVMHSFYIPDMRIKTDALPNRTTSLSFIAMDSDPTKSGTGPLTDKPKPDNGKLGRDHYIFCAEYCGEKHSEMAAILRVVPNDVYMAKLEEWGNLGEILPPVEHGAALYKTKGCVTCHSVDGAKNTGPSWKGYYGKPITFTVNGGIDKIDFNTTDGWDTYIRESIMVPGAKVHEGFENKMPMNTLNEKEINAIQAYIRKINGQPKAGDDVKPEKKK